MILGRFIQQKKEVVGIFAILLSILFMYSYQLDTTGLWFDEGFSLWMASKSISSIIQTTIQHDYNPPLYNLILHGWINLFGRSETAIRFLSVIFAILSVAGVWHIGVRLLNRQAGLAAALLTAFSSFHVVYAREARTYTMFGFLTLLCMYAFFEWTHHNRWFWGYLISCVLLLYTHPYAVFVLASQNVYFFLVRFLLRQPFQCSVIKWIGIQSSVGLLYAPWLMVTFMIVRKMQDTGSCLTAPSLWNLQELIMIFSSTHQKPIGHLFTILTGLSVFWIFLPQGHSSGSEKRTWNPSRADRFLFLSIWLAVPILFSFVISVFLVPILSYRYLICCLYPFYLLLAMGLNVIPVKALRYGICIGLVGFFLYQSIVYIRREKKQEWREAIALMEKQAQPGDMVLFNPALYGEVLYPIYSVRKDLIYSGIPADPWSPQIFPDVIHRQVEEIAAHHGRVWLFVAATRDVKGVIPSQLGLAYSHQERTDFLGFRLYCYTN
jgi:uncharacterized membrane protein